MSKTLHKTVFILFLGLLCSAGLAQPSLKGKPGVSKKYAIQSAQLADRSYKFAKLSYMISEADLVSNSLDSAKFFINESIIAMDSAILLANDSDLMALDLANVSKKFSNKALKKINRAMEAPRSERIEFAKDATLFSANAVADAYHASFYFRGELKKSEPPKKEEPKEKVVTKLDVDQTLFTMLEKEMADKLTANNTQIEKVKADIAKTKDPAKLSKLKAQLKKLEAEKTAIETKGADAKTKLTEINKQIEERDKTGKAPPEPKLAKGLKYENLEEWNKHVIMDAELPPGLLYQVQVGVYKNKVLYEVFKGLTPVYGKTMPQGVTFSIGMFEKFEDANQAKDYVKSIGLVDAFVVAYNNKKRINTTEAQKLEKK